MSDLAKRRYLDLLSCGAFATLGPKKLDSLHSEVGQYLKSTADRLEVAELYGIYELQFYLSLLTNHDVEAKSYLDQFNDQFAGQKSQKLMILRSMYHEATGDKKAAINTLGSDPDELRASRRLATFSRTAKDGSYDAPEYIKSLNHYLNLQPSDVITWAELGDVYSSVGHYEKAVFCFKEVLLHQPLAHNMFYKAGLNLYLHHLYLLGLKLDKKDALIESVAVLEHSRDCFLRSVEINESYTKGWLGVYLLSESALLEKLAANKSLSATKKIELLMSDMSKLSQLSRKQIMKIEKLADNAAFDEFLKSS